MLKYGIEIDEYSFCEKCDAEEESILNNFRYHEKEIVMKYLYNFLEKHTIIRKSAIGIGKFMILKKLQIPKHES